MALNLQSQSCAYKTILETKELRYDSLLKHALLFLIARSSLFDKNLLSDFNPTLKNKPVIRQVLLDFSRLLSLATHDQIEFENALPHLNLAQLLLLARNCFMALETRFSQPSALLTNLTHKISSIVGQTLATNLLNLPASNSELSLSVGYKILESIGIATGIASQLTRDNFVWVTILSISDCKQLNEIFEKSKHLDICFNGKSKYLFLHFPTLHMCRSPPQACKNAHKQELKNFPAVYSSILIKSQKKDCFKLHLVRFTRNSSSFSVSPAEIVHAAVIDELKNQMKSNGAFPKLRQASDENRVKPRINQSKNIIADARRKLKPTITPTRPNIYSVQPEWAKVKR